jgi:hypothetical protein
LIGTTVLRGRREKQSAVGGGEAITENGDVAVKNKPVMDESMRQVLIDCKEKLRLYRAQHSGEYVGGVEYMELMRRIDAALGLP